MIKKIFLVCAVTMLSGCATHYMDSAKSNNGGQFVVGAYDHKATVFHCPSSPEKGDCERIDVDYK